MASPPEKSPGKVGPPAGSANAIRHGLRSSKTPKGCRYIEHRCNALRRRLEEALLEVKGEISIADAAAINSSMKWERHSLLAAHWLRHEYEKLSPADFLRFSEAIAKGSDNRDKSIRLLDLDKPPEVIDLKTYLVEGDGSE